MTEAHATEAENPPRLLLVEGALARGEGLAGAFDSAFGLRPVVVELTCGRMAVELLRTSAFDVVVADLSCLVDLAEPAGERVGRLVRAATGALILVQAEDGSISLTLEAMRAGAHDCIRREADCERLVGRIADLARRHGKLRWLAGREPGSADGAGAGIDLDATDSRHIVLPMWRQEQRIIEQAIQSFAGNIAMAAAALELSPSTIYRKRQAWAEMDGKRTA